MEKKAGKNELTWNEAPKQNKPQESKKRVSKTWEAIQKWKGSVIVNDPTLLL